MRDQYNKWMVYLANNGEFWGNVGFLISLVFC